MIVIKNLVVDEFVFLVFFFVVYGYNDVLMIEFRLRESDMI